MLDLTTSGNKYRLGVGIVILNSKNQVWLGRLTHYNQWQFPQGGIEADETPEQAMYRELYEETGLKPEQVKIIAESRKWYSYRFPKGITHLQFIGSKHRWFLLRLVDDDAVFNLDIDREFVDYRWVNYWYPIRNIVFFKEEVYRKFLKEFARTVFGRKSRL